MTRDRKKNMLRTLEHTVEELERDIVTLRRHQNCSTTKSNKNEITPLHLPKHNRNPNLSTTSTGFLSITTITPLAMTRRP
jgi:predicted secreted Zn-dependent protease